MQRTTRILHYVGTPMLLVGLSLFDFYVGLLCYDSCPPESELAAATAARITDAVPIALISAVPVALAWILCLVQLARMHRLWELAALALTVPLVAGLSLLVLTVGTRGQLLPTTWLAHGSSWQDSFDWAVFLLLLWPIAIYAATYALRRR